MVIGVSASKAGNYYQDAELHQLNASTAAIALGDVIYLDPADDAFKTATTSAGLGGRFAVAAKTKPANDTEVLAVVSGTVDVKCDGTVAPGNPVICSTSNAGRVQEYVASTINATPGNADVTTARSEFLRIVGYYIGKGGANNNEHEGTARTAAQDGDIITIRLAGGI